MHVSVYIYICIYIYIHRGLILYSDKWKTRGSIDWTVVANHKFSLLQKDLTDASN